eukprot:6180302-Pleurochrysis_carterae.AAC.2
MQLEAVCAGSCLYGSCVNGTCICPSGTVGHADLLTGDLSDYGGAVLECASNVLALRTVWSVVLFFGSIALFASPLALHQQQQRFKVLRQQGGGQRWYRYQPFLYVAGHLTTGLVMIYVAAVKVATPNYERVIGIDPQLSVANLVISTFGLPITNSFFLNLLATFSQGLRSEMSPSPLWQAALGIARILFILAAVLVAITGLYTIPYLSVSPYSGRHVHRVCNYLMHLQRAVAMLFVIIASVAFTVEMLRNINHTLRERVVLAHWTRSPELRADVASLRRTRRKVITVQLAAIVASAGNLAFQVWLSARPVYSSYSVAYEYLVYMQIILLVLLMYIKLEASTGRQILQAIDLSLCFRRGNGVSPTGQAADPEIETHCHAEVRTVSLFLPAETLAASHGESTRVARVTIPAGITDVSVVVDENGARAPRADRGNAEKPAADSSAWQDSPSADDGHALQQQQTQLLEVAEQTGQRNENQEQQRRQRDKWDC